MSLTFSGIDELVSELYEEYNLAERDVRIETKRLEGVALEVEEAEDAVGVASTVAKIVQEQAHKQISEVVTRCLRAVFEEEAYEFGIVFEQKRSKTEARLVFLRNGEEMDPLKSSGGGAVDVASFALRVACLMISRPTLRRTIILDEPFKFVSEEYRPKAAKILELLSIEFCIQFIMVTHLKEFERGNVITL